MKEIEEALNDGQEFEAYKLREGFRARIYGDCHLESNPCETLEAACKEVAAKYKTWSDETK